MKLSLPSQIKTGGYDLMACQRYVEFNTFVLYYHFNLVMTLATDGTISFRGQEHRIPFVGCGNCKIHSK